MEIRNIQFFLLWVETRISVKLLLLWGPSGPNLDNGLFYQRNTAEHLSEAWLEKLPFVVKKMATHWLFSILCLQCHIWPTLKDRQRIIKKKSLACVCCPVGSLKLGEVRSARLIGRELLRGIYRLRSSRPLRPALGGRHTAHHREADLCEMTF